MASRFASLVESSTVISLFFSLSNGYVQCLSWQVVSLIVSGEVFFELGGGWGMGNSAGYRFFTSILDRVTGSSSTILRVGRDMADTVSNSLPGRVSQGLNELGTGVKLWAGRGGGKRGCRAG